VAGQLPPADLLHFHWVAEFIDIPSFLERVDMPIVWTLHDMNPFTGGCHYTSGCRRFEQACGCCPQLESKRGNGPSSRSWERKRAAYKKKARRDHLHVIAPSEWLAREAEQSALFSGVPINCIPHGLDHTLFRPRDAQHERRKISIPEGQKVALFVAHSSTDPRKGFGILSEALARLQFDDVTLISIGRNAPTVPEGLSHFHVGYVDEDQRLSVLYSMADVFIIPSLQEAFGQTALEAMACGTPVVGFDAGGIPDMVRPDETGWLAKTGNVRSLHQALETALENDGERERMGRRCREVVEEEYTLERQARQYKALYESILEQQ
jgi:glycosyltransferase involved in cell wall biosynthesis